MKKIGIIGSSVGENSWGVSKSYLEYFSKFGQVEILTPSKSIREDIDLVVMPGGGDTPSWRYNENPSFMNSNPDLWKEYFVKQNLQQYIDAGKAIWGTCLGLQQLNTFFGGSLTQHMYHEYSNPREELTHKVFKPALEKGTGKLLYNKESGCLITNPGGNFKVNSLHHQAVHWTQVADCMDILLVDEEGEYVEFMQHKTLPIMCCQWHGEEIYDAYSIKKIKELLKVTEKVTID